MRHTSLMLLCGLTVLGSSQFLVAQEAKPAANVIKPEAVNLGRPVDFEKDISPILDSNCVACHNLGQAESKLNLEKVEFILKGGKRGPSVVAKDPDKSLLYLVAARSQGPAMPPLPNKVDAKALTPKELGTLRQWILEGASSGMGGTKDQVNWQPVPATAKAIYSLAIAPWGRYVAAGRANFKDALTNIKNGNVKSSTTEVENEDRFIRLFVETVSERRRGWLVDDSKNFEARNLAGILGRSSLSVVKIGRNCNDRLINGLAEIGFCVRLELLQDHRRNFFGGELFVKRRNIGNGLPILTGL